MSFQRMLMMAAREPRPYLPHPEALVALYVPRWQIEQGNTLTDFSGNGYDLTRTSGGALTWDEETVMKTYTTVLGTTNLSEMMSNYTILARRRVDSVHRSNAMGIKFRVSSATFIYSEVSRSGGSWECGSLSGGANYVTLPPGEWTYQRTGDYNGTPIRHGTTPRLVDTLSVGAGYGTSYGSWVKIWCIAVWRQLLTNEEIQMAQRYLDTASLEDYMMSRL